MWTRIAQGLIVLAIVAAVAFWIGRATAPAPEPVPPTAMAEHEHEGTEPAAAEQVWTCSMDPEVRQDHPGKCPKCGMDLFLLNTGGQDFGARTIRLSAAAQALAEIHTSPVERRLAEVTMRLAGRVEADEARVRQVSAWSAGRIERLFVDSTGIPVKAGEHLVELYSPELYAAQEEFLQAQASVARLATSSDFARQGARETAQASRDKLRLLGFENDRIEAILQAGKPHPVLEIRSPAGGVVLEKQAREGMYVKTGTPLYTVADLSQVWVILDAYESELSYLRLGQEVKTRTEAYGDEEFAGRISFISPTLDPVTRTTRVRIVLQNPAGRLRPGMLTRSTIQVQLGERSVVVSDEFRGKWSCPMHPVVVKDEAGACPMCGMPLVPGESLGYADPADVALPLLVPASAVLTTGRRAVVYLREPADDSLFTGVEISIGPRAGDFYIVLAGLKEGQQVVTQGAFKIDSELQIQAKPSMMSPADKPKAPAEGAPPVPQKTCPIMGGAIDRELFVDVRGQRIYVCCPGCLDPIQKDPEAALGTLQKRGEFTESLQKTCPVMGGAVNQELFVDYQGRRLYVCCAGCLDKVRAEPAKYADLIAEQLEAKP